MSYTIDDVVRDLRATENGGPKSPAGIILGAILGLLFYSCLAFAVWRLFAK